MDIEQNFKASVKLRKLFQDQLKENYNIRSSDRLARSVERKFKTTFIGSLNAFQQAFGRLWGDGLAEEKLTDDQLKFRKLWEQTRTNVLNNGNNQLRAALQEISEYTVEWGRHQTNLPVKELNSNA